MSRLCMVVVICLAAGCWNNPVPVGGTVAGADGKPLANVVVQFVAEHGPATASATTDSAGRYELASSTGQPGAVPGSYKVILLDNPTDDDSSLGKAPLPAVRRIPVQYTSAVHTPLHVIIEPGKEQYDFKIESR